MTFSVSMLFVVVVLQRRLGDLEVNLLSFLKKLSVLHQPLCLRIFTFFFIFRHFEHIFLHYFQRWEAAHIHEGVA